VFRVSYFGFWAHGFGFRVSGSGFRDSGSGFLNQGFGFNVSGPRVLEARRLATLLLLLRRLYYSQA